MLKTIKENGATIIEVDRFSKDDLKQEKIFSGKVKGIALPISFEILNNKKIKRQEIYCYFSCLAQNVNSCEETKKRIRLLYKNGKYAPHTHLIPMSTHERSRNEDSILMGVDFSRLKYTITSEELPATATIRETLKFFPCYHDVLSMMINHFEKPAFFITLLPGTILLNVKCSNKSYLRIPLQHAQGNCSDGVGHPHIHIVDDGVSCVRFFKQIAWDKLEFEEDDHRFLDDSGAPILDDTSQYLTFK